MIDRIIEFSANNRFLVFTLAAVACLAGWWSMQNVPLDAIPDLSDTQVIVYSRWDRSPDIIEDQVTYPIVTAMLGAPKVKAVRGFSDFGYSYVYVIFEDGTDIYWARSRTLEYLSSVLPALPAGRARPSSGPDATGLGWVFQYASGGYFGQAQPGRVALASGLVSALPPESRSGRGRSRADRRLRQAVPGQPRSQPAAGLRTSPSARWWRPSAAATTKSGGRLVEFGGTEYMVRGRGYAQSVGGHREHRRHEPARTAPPSAFEDIGQVVTGARHPPRRRRSRRPGRGRLAASWSCARARTRCDVIDRVKAKHQARSSPALPAGVKIVPIYDRSELIQRSIDNLKHTLIEVIVTVAWSSCSSSGTFPAP